MKAETSEIVRNMEFLVKELHKEWDRPYRTELYSTF